MRTSLLSPFFVAAALLAPPTHAADAPGLATDAQAKALCASAAEQFGKGDVTGAFKAMSAHWPLPSDELDALAIQSKTKLGLVSARFGSYVGLEHIRSQAAGESFSRHLFAIKYERHALRFSCAFYRPHDKWLINNVKWDDSAVLPVD